MKGGISMNAAVINKNAKLQRVPEACADTNWSRNTLMKVAAEANAIIRVGRTVRIDMPVLYKYIDMVYKAKSISFLYWPGRLTSMRMEHIKLISQEQD